MDVTPSVCATYTPDEVLKPLRPPKTPHPEVATSNFSLSINAPVFVPSYVPSTSNDDYTNRLLKNNRNLPDYHPRLLNLQQRKEEELQYLQYEQQQEQQQQSFFNTCGHQRMLELQQSIKNLDGQLTSLKVFSVQDRLHTPNRGSDVYYYQQQQQQQQQQQRRDNIGQQPNYQQNNNYRYNNNHHNHNQQQQQQQQQHHQQPQHQHLHSQHQQRYNNQQNQKRHQQQQQQDKQYNEQNQQQSTSASASVVAESANDMENIALDYLQTVIQCLNQNPGQFDTIAIRFNYIFEGMENNVNVLSNAMEDIFNESIKNPNFRYMGAKLYNLLHTLNSNKDSLFYTLLKYKLEDHQKKVLDYIEKKQEAKVRETALFLAELYMQLRGDSFRNHLIAENIVFSLKKLLSIEDNKDNIRCICLTLKLAGYDLSSDCADDMKDIIAKLDAINVQNPGKYPMANNVISLQKNNWGRKLIGAVSLGYSEKSQPQESLRESDDPVFYGPDGREITAEECEFLTNGAADTAFSSDNEDDDNDDIDLDPEMDEETERDYKLFLKQSNNKLQVINNLKHDS